MRETIGETIRAIYDAAIAEGAKPVIAVMDYLTEKNEKRCTVFNAEWMIGKHVIDYRSKQAASEYAADTPLGHALEESGEVDG